MISSFIFYDVIFLIIFTLYIVHFLYKRRHKLTKDGWMYLYKTKLGIEFIEYTSKKYSKLLKTIQPIVILSGFILMTSITYLLIKSFYLYFKYSLNKVISAPPIFPIFPYFTEFFNLNSFFPPFYFTYFIIAILIIAVSHEYAHGIYARLHKIKIHSTGFAFLGPFLGAFVEQDDKQMNKAKKIPQMGILAAGTFANVIMAIIFGLLMWLFIACTFTPAGIYFSSYAVTPVNLSEIDSSMNVTLNNQSFIELKSKNVSYYTTEQALEYSSSNNLDIVNSYYSSPAFLSGLSGAIHTINGKTITSPESLTSELSKYSPGDNVIIETADKSGKIKSQNITLGNNKGKAFLGVGISPVTTSGFLGKLGSLFAKIKDPRIYYESTIGDLGTFIYNLLWWIVTLNVIVALMNMLPVGIFDGGRFFYLAVLGLTKSKKIAENAFKTSTWIFIIILILMIFKWITGFF